MRTGRCLCKSLRFEAEGAAIWIGHCHCESCRRNCSAGVATFAGMPRSGFRWIGEPAEYSSSPGVTRYFCGTCGTPMAYANRTLPDEIHLYLASFDDQTGLMPERHYHYDEHVGWLTLADDLPRGSG